MEINKIDYVCGAAEILGYQINWTKAKRIADAFTLTELQRIYWKIRNTGTRKVTYERKIG